MDFFFVLDTVEMSVEITRVSTHPGLNQTAMMAMMIFLRLYILSISTEILRKEEQARQSNVFRKAQESPR